MRALFCVGRGISLADPTPFMLAEGADHVGAATILLDSNETVLAMAYHIICLEVGPFLILLLYVCFTSLLFVRGP